MSTEEPSTAGLKLSTNRPWLAGLVELLSSMRFAISLLTLVSVASTIGTVLKQGEPLSNYTNQFGPFWFEVFRKLDLYTLYSAWWFLLIMGFLVLSTSLCLVRNAPRMLKDMRSWRDNVREQSLRNFHHRAEWAAATPRAEAARRIADTVAASGYKVKLVEKDGATLVAAKQGAANKFGYIFAHSAIVIICVGGMLDSDLPIRFQQWLYDKSAFNGNGIIAQIPAQHRLGLGNPSFRGATNIPEGGASQTAIIQQQNGVLIQDLPFTIHLKRFVIDFYSTGMPKLFASEVQIRDHETNQTFDATIKVNHPLIYKGIAVYQSSFEDGGSRLRLQAHAMAGERLVSFPLGGEVGSTTTLGGGTEDAITIEWTGFRPFNVENTASSDAAGQDPRAVAKGQTFAERFSAGLDKRMGSAAQNSNNKDLKNVGPSVQFKLVDKTGQRREFQNYMQPVLLDNAYVFLSGVRSSLGDPFSYLRIPADDNDSVDEWMRLRAAVSDPALRARAAERYAQRAMPGGASAGATSEKTRDQLRESALKSLSIFAGDGKQGGYLAVSAFLEKVPPASQEKAAEIFMKILNGSMWDLWQAARERDGLPPVESDEKHGRFLQLATNAVSDAFFYGAPVYLQLKEFDQVKASVLQVTRSPGKKVVYLGCLFLVLGVFSMFYIRERRLWIWLKDGPDGAQVLMALSAQRKTLDFEREFIDLKARLEKAA